MSGVVYFKFKSAIASDSVSYDGTFISVAELKALIAEKKGLGREAGTELILSDPSTSKDYDDDAQLIARNSSVLVRRAPANRLKPLQAGAAASAAAAPATGRADVTAAPSAAAEDAEFGADPYASRPAALQDDEEKALQSRLEAAAKDWNQQLGRGRGRGRGPSTGPAGRGRFGFGRGSNVPPAHYVCHRCGQGGHWIHECPTLNDPNHEVKRVRPPVGIPMTRLAASQEGGLLLPDGTVGTLYANEDAFARDMAFLPGSAHQQAAAGQQGEQQQEAGQLAALQSAAAPQQPPAAKPLLLDQKPFNSEEPQLAGEEETGLQPISPIAPASPPASKPEGSATGSDRQASEQPTSQPAVARTLMQQLAELRFPRGLLPRGPVEFVLRAFALEAPLPQDKFEDLQDEARAKYGYQPLRRQRAATSRERSVSAERSRGRVRKRSRTRSRSREQASRRSGERQRARSPVRHDEHRRVDSRHDSLRRSRRNASLSPQRAEPRRQRSRSPHHTRSQRHASRSPERPRSRRQASQSPERARHRQKPAVERHTQRSSALQQSDLRHKLAAKQKARLLPENTGASGADGERWDAMQSEDSRPAAAALAAVSPRPASEPERSADVPPAGAADQAAAVGVPGGAHALQAPNRAAEARLAQAQSPSAIRSAHRAASQEAPAAVETSAAAPEEGKGEEAAVSHGPLPKTFTFQLEVEPAGQAAGTEAGKKEKKKKKHKKHKKHKREDAAREASTAAALSGSQASLPDAAAHGNGATSQSPAVQYAGTPEHAQKRREAPGVSSASVPADKAAHPVAEAKRTRRGAEALFSRALAGAMRQAAGRSDAQQEQEQRSARSDTERAERRAAKKRRKAET